MFLNGQAARGFGRPDGDVVYPVYGNTKRKLNIDDNFQQLNEEEQMHLQAVKRQRLAPPEHQLACADVPMEQEERMDTLLGQEINHNLPPNFQMNLSAHQAQVPAAVEEQAPPLPQQLPQMPQDNFPMNINDETYSCYNLDQETIAMNSDGVPDPRQYRTEGMIFPCGENCVGGEHSPTTGRVKCYCRPSWEGMQGIVPYFSDYY